MTTAIQPTKTKQLTIRERIDTAEFRAEVERALPRHLKPDRFIRVACTALMRTPKLAQCDQVSFFNALLSLSQMGLEPDGRHAHLIPFENRKRGVTECQLIVDYKGLVDLAMRSGVIANIHADIVCDGDEFDFDRGAITRHKIDFRKPRGKAYAAYALCRFRDGTEKAEVLSHEEIESIRSRSRAGQSGPWVTDWSEMAKKTAFRRLSKWLPLAAEFRDALEQDDDRVDNAIVPAKPVFTSAAPIFTMPQAEELPPAAEEPDHVPGLEPVRMERGPELVKHPLHKPEQGTAAYSGTTVPLTTTPVSPTMGTTIAQTATTPDTKTIQEQLAGIVLTAGFTFDQFQTWAIASGQYDSELGSFDEVTGGKAKMLVGASRTMLKQITATVGRPTKTNQTTLNV